jgi:hypothetical protein
VNNSISSIFDNGVIARPSQVTVANSFAFIPIKTVEFVPPGLEESTPRMFFLSHTTGLDHH